MSTMWIMASFGVLMPSIRPPETVAEGDPQTMQIRSRRRQDLDILRDEYMLGTLGPTIELPASDYEFRAYCTPQAFADALVTLTLNVDYQKFKPTTERYKDDALHNLYNEIWSVMFSSFSTEKHQKEYWGLTSGVDLSSWEDQNRYDEAMDRYAGFIARHYPERLNNVKPWNDEDLDNLELNGIDTETDRLTVGEVAAQLRVSNNKVRQFLKGSPAWRSSKTGVLKTDMPRLCAEFDVWYTKRVTK